MSPSVGLQISFLCRLIKLVRHISNYRHLISTGSTFSVSPTKRAPGVSLFRRRLSVTVPKRVCLPLSSLSLCLSLCLSVSLTLWTVTRPPSPPPFAQPPLDLFKVISPLLLWRSSEKFEFLSSSAFSSCFHLPACRRNNGMVTIESKSATPNGRESAPLSLSLSPYLLFIFLPRWEY